MESGELQVVEGIRTFAELKERAREVGPKRVGVVLADDEVALTAAADALRIGIALPVLLGDVQQIRARAEKLGLAELAAKAEFVSAMEENAAEIAVEMAREGSVDILLKGHLRTDQLFHPVLDKEKGLRTGRLLSDMAFFEQRGEGGPRLTGITDGGLNPAPTLEQKKQIVLNAIEMLHCLGFRRPKIAVVSATEMVSEAMASTVDAKALTEMCAAGEFGEAEVFGPLALDNALMEWAAKAKGISNPVAGHADCLLVPTVEAGNLLAKSIIFLAGWEFGHAVVGAKVPILIPSRVESAQDKVNAMALGVLYASR
ncbi:MAG: phosphate acyltransferase [Terracidiphilus sp.]